MINLKKKPTLTKILYIIDSSGSMSHLRNDVVGGFNTFLKEQQELPGEATLTLVSFDTIAKTIINNMPIKQVAPLTLENYVTMGGTALLDAIGGTVNSGMLHALNGGETKYIVVIVTDGEENSSRLYTKDTIRNLISKRTEEGWTFMYFGANQNSFTEAAKLNIPSQFTFNYDANPQGVLRAYATSSASVGALRGGN